MALRIAGINRRQPAAAAGSGALCMTRYQQSLRRQRQHRQSPSGAAATAYGIMSAYGVINRLPSKAAAKKLSGDARNQP